MKKTVIAALVIFGFMFASFARADVFPVEGQPGMFRMSGVVDKYEAYDAKKADGKIGRLYAYPHNKAGEKDKIKKFYITDKTKVTKKGGGEGVIADLTKDTITLITYRRVVKKKEDKLIATEVEIQ